MNAVSGVTDGPAASGGNVTVPAAGLGTRGPEIADYLASVRAALADLAPAERDGLLEDLPEHLAEVAQADSAPLRVRLGQPADFAAELRSAAGVATPASDAATDGRILTAELVRAFVRRWDLAAGRLLGYPRMRDFLVALRPAWWVVRGAGITTFVLVIGGILNRYYTSSGQLCAATILGLLGATLSTRLGRATERADASLRRVVTAVDILCLAFVLYTAYVLVA
jgi:hypothetical protein